MVVQMAVRNYYILKPLLVNTLFCFAVIGVLLAWKSAGAGLGLLL